MTFMNIYDESNKNKTHKHYDIYDYMMNQTKT
jgi:hypothetical protein